MARRRDKTAANGAGGNRRAPIIIGVAVVILGGGIWLLSQNIAGVSKPSAPPAPTVNLLPPPPPPPPPPPEPKTPPPPEKTVEAPSPKPDASPKPDNQPKQLTIAGPAQAGSDSFGIGAGKGGGSSVIGGSGEGGPGGGGGGGFEEAAYRRFINAEIQAAVQANSKIDHAFSAADMAVHVDRQGRITHVRIRKSSGSDNVDVELVATVARMRPLSEAPPKQWQAQYSVEVKIRGARG